MRQIKFTKYDAAGNTFLVVEQDSARLDRRALGRISEKLCDPVSGIGADGLLLMRPSGVADFALDIFNADGSWAERSGNGLRAAVAHALHKRTYKKNWTVACQREIVAAKVVSHSTKQTVISAEIGVPVISKPAYIGAPFKLSQLPELKALGDKYRYVRIQIGNPHVVVVVKSIPHNWVELGRAIAKQSRFRSGVNIEFVRSIGPRRCEVRVFERGVGATQSSGTGAAAALVALRILDRVTTRAVIDFGRQTLSANWSGLEQMVSVSGPVRTCFSGEAPL